MAVNYYCTDRQTSTPSTLFYYSQDYWLFTLTTPALPQTLVTLTDKPQVCIFKRINPSAHLSEKPHESCWDSRGLFCDPGDIFTLPPYTEREKSPREIQLVLSVALANGNKGSSVHFIIWTSAPYTLLIPGPRHQTRGKGRSFTLHPKPWSQGRVERGRCSSISTLIR